MVSKLMKLKHSYWHHSSLALYYAPYIFRRCFELFFGIEKLQYWRKLVTKVNFAIIPSSHSRFAPFHSSLSQFHAGIEWDCEEIITKSHTTHLNRIPDVQQPSMLLGVCVYMCVHVCGECEFNHTLLATPTSAFGPMNTSPSNPPAITRTCLGRPTLQEARTAQQDTLELIRTP